MSTKSQKKFDLERRRARVAELYAQRYTTARIALVLEEEGMGVSDTTVRSDVRACVRQFQRVQADGVAAARLVDLATIDRAISEAFQRGRISAIAPLLKRRASLLGLDRPIVIKGRVDVSLFNKPLSEMSDEELEEYALDGDAGDNTGEVDS